MEAVTLVPAQVWLAIHIAGVLLAVSSRSHLAPLCAFCTNVLLTSSTLVVGGVAIVGFIYQQPYWAMSGCTLGMMAVISVFERSSYEHETTLLAVASSPSNSSQ